MSALFEQSEKAVVLLISGAVFSDCQAFRYQLHRIWDESLPYVNVIGVNPSTADAYKDDPTIRKCIKYSKAWGYGGLYMTNLFAFRSTDPKGVRKVSEPVGEFNNKWLVKTAQSAGIVIAAWGNNGRYIDRDKRVIAMLPELHCMEISDDGNPKHPLYLKDSLTPIPYRRR